MPDRESESRENEAIETEAATPSPNNGATHSNGHGNGNGSAEGAPREAVRERLRRLATASSFPEADEQGKASFSVDSAEGLRATFPGQDTDEGDRVVVDRAEAAFKVLYEKERLERESSAQ